MAQISEKTISFPFNISPQGVVETTTDQSKIWADRVLAVISTGVGERVQRFDFGTEMYQMSFATQETAIAEAKLMVAKAFSSQLPLLTLVSVDGSFDPATGTVSISIGYRLPNKELVNLSLNSLSINGSNPPREL